VKNKKERLWWMTTTLAANLFPESTIDSDDCINVISSESEGENVAEEEEEAEEERPINPFVNWHPFGPRRQCFDRNLNPRFFPTIAQVRLMIPDPLGHRETASLNPTWHPRTEQWGAWPTTSIPAFYPYSQLLYLATQSRLPSCRFYHIIWNTNFDLSNVWLDLPCGCLDPSPFNPWLGAGWLEHYFPYLYERVQQVH
jgi:hypothetical protein